MIQPLPSNVRTTTDTVWLDEIPHKNTDTPRSRSRTGYGPRIPTCWLVQLPGRGKVWRRVYCAIWSNSGTCYVDGAVKGVKWTVIILG